MKIIIKKKYFNLCLNIYRVFSIYRCELKKKKIKEVTKMKLKQKADYDGSETSWRVGKRKKNKKFRIFHSSGSLITIYMKSCRLGFQKWQPKRKEIKKNLL